MANTDRVPPVPVSISDPVHKQFLERIRQSIVDIRSENIAPSGGGPPYLSIAGGTLTGDLAIDPLGVGEQLISTDITGKLELSGKYPSDITVNSNNIVSNAFNIASNALDISQNTDDIAELRTDVVSVSGNLQEQIDNNYTSIVSVSGNLQDQIDNNYTSIVSVSGNLQDQIDNNYTSIVSTSGNLQDQIDNNYTSIVSTSGNLQDQIDNNYTSIVSVSGNLQEQIDNNYTSIVSVSGNLQNQIDNNYTSIVSTSGNLQDQIDNNYTTIVSVSGNLQDQIDNNYTSIVSVSGNLQDQIDNNYTTIVSVSGNLQDQIDEFSVTNIRGQEICEIDQQIYDISYGQTISGGQPITSLEIPISSSTIFVQGIYDVTDTGFKVMLSESPAVSGYAINWITSFGNAIEVPEGITQEELDAVTTYSWTFLLNTWTTSPTLNTSISGLGDVYDYVYDTETYYRLVPEPYDSTQDTFYDSFDGSNLTNPVATRGQSI